MPPQPATSRGSVTSAAAAKKPDRMAPMILHSRDWGTKRLGGCGLRDARTGLVTRGLRLVTELFEARDHEAIGLARERRRKNSVPFGISRQLLGERDQV